MKEKIGIKKLLDLLIHYEWHLHKRGRHQYSPRIEGEDIILENEILGGYEQIDTGYLIICSKWYGFIEWLVENEKIEYKNLNKIHTRKGLNVLIEQELYEDLIMLLSIQDEPIEFLISLLKNVEKSD